MKTKEEIQTLLAELRAKRLRRGDATNIVINAPLALEQLALDVRCDALEWVLK